MKNKVMQEQLDEYAEKLTTISNMLAEFAKSKDVLAADFYLACASISRHFAEKISEEYAEEFQKFIDIVASEFVKQGQAQRKNAE